MFRSINSKFYTFAGILVLIFSIGYGILAYSLSEQSQSILVMQEAASIESEIHSLGDLFFEIRFWEKTILFQESPEADKKFGSIIKQMRERLNTLNSEQLGMSIKGKMGQVAKGLTQYEVGFNKIIQSKTEQRLHRTRMDTNYRSLASYILRSNKNDLLKPLFNLTRFLISYRIDHRESEYQALILVLDYLENRFLQAKLMDDRVKGYLESFRDLLDKDFALEIEIRSINKRFDEISARLMGLFTDTSQESENLLRKEIQDIEKRKEKLNRFFFISTIISIPTLLLILRVISKKIINPIRSVAVVMREVKTGNIKARFAFLGNKKDEIVQFGLSFNDMLDTLEKNNQQLVSYQNELEKKLSELKTEIAERKRAESERQRLTIQLQRAEKMEAIGTLAGGVAHDLNNILSGIASYPELLLLDLSEDSPLRKPILTIQESGQRAATIVQDLLTLARRGVAVTDVVNLNLIVSDYLKSPEHEKLKSIYTEVQIGTDLDPSLLNIIGSPIHLSKALMNLVSNAAESMKNGGMLFIKTKNRYIDRPIRSYDDVEEGDYAVLSVSDSGIGISPDDLKRIFEPFYTKKVMGRSGTGLGMSVVWGTIKDHKGYIDVQSTEGKGTTFTLYFPATRNEQAEDKSPLAIKDYMGKENSILIVDDVKEQREIATRILEKLGYFVMSVSSGEEAVDCLKTRSVDLIILDMIMDPGIDGLETYRRIMELHPGQKAIIASGFSETERVTKTQLLGAGAYIKKPYTLETIGLAVKRELEK